MGKGQQIRALNVIMTKYPDIKRHFKRNLYRIFLSPSNPMCSDNPCKSFNTVVENMTLDQTSVLYLENHALKTLERLTKGEKISFPKKQKQHGID